MFLLSLPISLFAMDGIQQWDGKHYQKHSSLQFKTVMELLSILDLKKCSWILDVGSGSGQVTAIISHMAPQAKVALRHSSFIYFQRF